MTTSGEAPHNESGHQLLSGIRVLDLSRVLSGPHCGRLLADLGAEVIKVEPPEGDMTRFGFPRRNGLSTYFMQQNCGKLNLSLDMKHPDALPILWELVDRSDILLENFRPGVMDRIGLPWSALTARNPRLIQGSITGYGQTGPWRHRRAYAPVVGAESGLTYMQGMARGGRFANDPMSHGDLYSGISTLAGILAALYARERTGRGQWVEVSMVEALLSANDNIQWDLASDEIDSSNDIPSFRPGDLPVLHTRNGQTVVVGGHPAALGNFRSYMQVCGRTDLLDDPTLATVKQRRERLPDIVAVLQEWASTVADADTLEAEFYEVNIAVGVLRSVAELAKTPWVEARNAIVEIDDRSGGTLKVPNSPWHFSDNTSGVVGIPKYRGEDNRAILRDLLGMDDARIDELERTNVLSSRGPSH